tara:strand:+ start:4802 stop:5521 length:720 start_codon:yes stop_codon:yes gene_type:complete
MLADLEDLLSGEFDRKTKILILLNHNEASSKAVKEIKQLGKANGLRDIEKWNISMILSSLKGYASNLKDGWTLTSKGEKHLEELKIIGKSPIIIHHKNLTEQTKKIKSLYVQEFINEAIISLEYKLLKSAVVFSWIGAISTIYEFVEKNKLSDFNAEAKRRFPKWKTASNIDGLTRMKEYDFLQIIEGIGIIGKNTKNELESCLKLRNSCGHPSTLKIGENKVAAHIEILILNVYKPFT